MNRIGQHLEWPTIHSAIRQARQEYCDDEWHGRNAQPAKARLDALLRAHEDGQRYMPPF